MIKWITRLLAILVGTVIAALLLLYLLTPTAPASAPLIAAPAGTLALFNGRDLSGWRVHGLGVWQVHEGELWLRGGLGYLAAQPQLTGDFQLSLEYSAPAWANSGLFFYADHPTGLRPWPVGFEIQLHDGGQRFPTGSLYGQVQARTVAATSNWQRLTISVQGRQLRVERNGAAVLATTLPPGPRTGLLALQAHDPWSWVGFRDIVLQRAAR